MKATSHVSSGEINLTEASTSANASTIDASSKSTSPHKNHQYN